MRRATDRGKLDYEAPVMFAERTALAIDGPHNRGPLTNQVELLKQKRYWEYDALVPTDMLEVMWLVARELATLRDFRVLDVGCGYGRWAPLFALLDCAEYVGVDPVPGRIEQARLRHGGPRVQFLAVEMQAFAPAFLGRFDIIFACAVLQHLARPQKLAAVEQMKALLAPKGRVLLWDGQIVEADGQTADTLYEDSGHPFHMIPIARQELAASFSPLALSRVKQCLWVAGGVPDRLEAS